MGEAARSSERLDSWKEIAAFFGRDERTVRRWEKENSLPIHRVPGGAKGRVFAYEDELSQWLRTPQALAQDNSRWKTVQTEIRPAGSVSRRLGWLTVGKWAAALVVCGLLVWGILAYRKNHGFAVHAAGAGASGNPTANFNAQDFYLKGRYYWNKRTPDDLNRAVDLFTQAIVQDPKYAPAYVGLADCYNLLREFSVMPPAEAFPRARAAAQKAVELDPSSAEAHNSLAFALFWGYIDVADAEREFKRALELEPNNVRAHHWYATFLVALRRFPEALAEVERARQLDPSSTPVLTDKAFILWKAGQPEQAIGLLKQIEAGEPSFLSAHKYLAGIYLDQGKYLPYLQELQTAVQLQHDTGQQLALSAEEKAFALGGSRAMFEARLQQDEDLYGQGRLAEFDVAVDNALLGRNPEALQHLEGSYERHESGLTSLAVNSAFRNLHSDPAFKDLLAKIGLPPVK